MASPKSARALYLSRRPTGEIDAGCFEARETQLPPLSEGDVLVDNLVMSVDPYMYLRASGDGAIARGGYEIGETPDAHTIGRVRESRSDRFRSGDLVSSFLGWRDRFVAPAEAVEALPPGFDYAPEDYIAAVGMTPFTAWVGMTAFTQTVAGGTIFVSGAAGGVGMIACQIALRAGMRVVASAGSARKRAWLESLGDVRTIDYRATSDLTTALIEAAPERLDLTFDTVGGNHLEAAIGAAKPLTHIIACGAISSFVPRGDPRSILTDLRMLPVQTVTIHGYTVSRFFHLHPAFLDHMRAWRGEGGPVAPTTIFETLDSAPEALRSLFGGDNLGKTLVRLGS